MRLLPSETPPTFSGNRVGLFGGSFNPPHQGHLDAAKIALKRAQLDRIWWLVTPGNPLKDTRELAALDARIASCRSMIDDRRMIVTGLERQLATRYTADTVAHLVQQRPTTRFVWIMGGDAWATFHRWWRWQDILTMVPILIVDRPDFRLKAMSSKAALHYEQYQVPEHDAGRLARSRTPAWCYVTAPQNELSSTQLRQA